MTCLQWLKDFIADFRALESISFSHHKRGYNPRPAKAPNRPIITPAPPDRKCTGAHFTTGGQITCPNCGEAVQLLGGRKHFSRESCPCD